MTNDIIYTACMAHETMTVHIQLLFCAMMQNGGLGMVTVIPTNTG